jgi:GNAT superfamily N-acetyltransferase
VSALVVPLADEYSIDGFTSGHGDLDDWLARASGLQARDAVRVYVIADDGVVVAYSALLVATVKPVGIPARVRGGLSEIPALLMGKLAVATNAQGRGLGKALLGHAARQAVEIRQMAGIKLLAAHPIDEQARTWYEHQGMRTTTDGALCYVRIKDLVE